MKQAATLDRLDLASTRKCPCGRLRMQCGTVSGDALAHSPGSVGLIDRFGLGGVTKSQWGRLNRAKKRCFSYHGMLAGDAQPRCMSALMGLWARAAETWTL